jgi:hypothetical protein
MNDVGRAWLISCSLRASARAPLISFATILGSPGGKFTALLPPPRIPSLLEQHLDRLRAFYEVSPTEPLGQSVKDTLCGMKALSKKDYERIDANRAQFGGFDPSLISISFSEVTSCT